MSNTSQKSTQSLPGYTGSMIPVPVPQGISPASCLHTPLFPAAQWTKHAALRSRNDLSLSPGEWFNVNCRIKKTVDILLSHGYLIQGPGPKTYELHSNLGVALCAEIAIRPIQRTCSLADSVLQEKLLAMANDPRHAEFRYTYLNGRVWFFFRIIDLELARQPLVEDVDVDDVDDDDDDDDDSDTF
ncbi:hypothetical protein F5Y10DRAFT_270689 [Nemania abortiva]|nr:hypothetical protein F5Y10DRAFT_270689 [Nemania abortiva]